ncbi:MAG TPA: M28 family metallopeptidase [Acidisarcina sp.]|nr:M28 family metallopeptidase [Acidisarcina sp.]
MKKSRVGFRIPHVSISHYWNPRPGIWLLPLAALLVTSPAYLHADPPSRDLDAAGHPVAIAPVDPAIRQALSQVSALEIRRTIEKLVSFGNRNTLSSMETGLPANTGAAAAADWLEGELQRFSAQCGNCLEVKRDTFTETPQSRIPRPTVITNIYAILRGTDPARTKEIYLVSGHYDSRNTDTLDTRKAAPGANDDASGTAVSLECARVLSRLKFPATVVFAVVDGEEQGLNGSRHLAKLAKAEGWQIRGVLNNDIVGGDTTPGSTQQQKSLVRVFSEGVPVTTTPEQLKGIQTLGSENDSPSRELARATVEVARSYFRVVNQSGDIAYRSTSFRPVMEYRRDRFLRGGDHTSFNQEGYAAVRLTEWRENFDHQHQDVRTENGVEYGDLARFVDYDYVANVTRLNAATLATLASAPAPPDEVKISTKNLDNNSTLSWKPGPGMAAKSYEIVWRETSEAEWQRAAASNGATTITLPVSKDNVIFGVRAVDAAGHRSLAVLPTPER